MTPAMRGTAAHHFLEVCDLDMGAQSVEKETKRLVSLGKLTEVEAAAADKKCLSDFLKAICSSESRMQIRYTESKNLQLPFRSAN